MSKHTKPAFCLRRGSPPLIRKRSAKEKLLANVARNQEALRQRSIDLSVTAHLNLVDGLSKACTSGDVDAVRDFLRRGADPSGDMDLSGQKPIHDAAKGGHVEVIRVLLDAGAEINLQSGEVFNSALHCACETKNAEVVRLLLDAKADVHAKNRFGYTPLHCARSVDVATLLLDAGADINAVNIHGETPFFKVGHNGDIVRFLCERGANPDARDKGGRTALHAAVLCSRPQAERITMARNYLEWGVPVNAQDKSGNTALHVASYSGLVRVAIFLTRVPGIDIEIPNNDGRTASEVKSNFFNQTVNDF